MARVQILATLVCLSSLAAACSEKSAASIGMAVEFMDHAAAAYVARDKGWYKARDLNISDYTSYVTGMALAAALARRDIQVAYMCLVPAINAYANAKVPLKIVAGTHKFGYALVANPKVADKPEDLARPGVRIGCVREGGAVDVLMNRFIDNYRLDRRQVLNRVRRMSPPRLLVAIKTGRLDAAFLPEQWASMAEDLGFVMQLTARDIWPGMQGSVLVVKQELVKNNPELVRKLVEVNDRATGWINENPRQAAEILARVLSATGRKVKATHAAPITADWEISPETIRRSMGRLDYSTAISTDEVQRVIDYLAGLGYIKKSYPAGEIVDTRFIQ